jgi:hypothetical protein
MARVEERRAASQFYQQRLAYDPAPNVGLAVAGLKRDGDLANAGGYQRATQDRNRPRSELNAEIAQLSAKIYDLEIKRGDRRPNPMSDVTPQSGTNPEIDDAELRLLEARRQQAITAAAEQVDRGAKEHADRLVALADEMLREREWIAERQRQIEAYNAEQQLIAEEDRKRRAIQEAEVREGEIKDAQSRYAQALGGNYDIRDPYGSLARSAMAEYGSFKRDREDLTRQIAEERDPSRRRTLELRRDIEAADYMSITSHRIASQSEIIVGRSNTDEAVRQREQAAKFEAEAKELRRQYREQIAEQELSNDPETTSTSRRKFEPLWGLCQATRGLPFTVQRNGFAIVALK